MAPFNDLATMVWTGSTVKAAASEGSRESAVDGVLGDRGPHSQSRRRKLLAHKGSRGGGGRREPGN